MTKGKVKFPRAPMSLTALEDIWLRRATEVAIEKARSVVRGGASQYCDRTIERR